MSADSILPQPGKVDASQVWLVLFIISVVLPVPIALIYSFVFYRKTSWYRGVILFSLVVGVGYISNLIFYRTMIMNDKEAKIDKMGKKDALFVFWNTLAAFVIVAVTMFGLGTNPNLITIFENTLGYWFIHIWGLSKLMSSIVKSNVFDKIDAKNFNYNFLITQINLNNLEQVINMAKSSSTTSTPSIKYPLDFHIEFDKDVAIQNKQISTLQSLVGTKHAFGHFVWIYLSSLVAILVSMLACVM